LSFPFGTKRDNSDVSQLILFIKDIFYSAVSSSNSVVINGRMTSDENELERIWKEGVTAKL
jgi:hypothetical protein